MTYMNFVMLKIKFLNLYKVKSDTFLKFLRRLIRDFAIPFDLNSRGRRIVFNLCKETENYQIGRTKLAGSTLTAMFYE